MAFAIYVTETVVSAYEFDTEAEAREAENPDAQASREPAPPGRQGRIHAAEICY